MKNKSFRNACILFVIFLILLILDIYKCPFKYVLGISCPFCGLTRAIYYALHFNFKKSFHYHLLWPIILIGILIHVLYELKIITINKKTIYISLYLFTFINFIYYLYRFYNGSEIVNFTFNESLLYKIYLFIKNIILSIK